jgi:hypothetical protein
MRSKHVIRYSGNYGIHPAFNVVGLAAYDGRS